MIALVRYLFTTLLLSQRYLAPLLLLLGLVTVLTSSDTGPLSATYGAVAGAVLPCSVWLTTALIGLEDAPHRSIVTVSAGGRTRVLLATVATAGVWCVLFTAVGLVLPLLLGSHTPGPADLLLGVVAQLVCAVTGMAIGVVCSRLVFRRQGYALAAALVLLSAALLGRGVSPVNLLLGRLQNTPDPASAVAPAGGLLVLAVALLAGALAVTGAVSRRRA
ncbi:hypothetical protein AB0O01_17630 [Streptomyces sp. NPDC093252]|uniref:hypothetical protein n=1 Tax=Streptomyces sp. NPDC093252 TaxID=3154980 RepID=UPI003434BED5